MSSGDGSRLRRVEDQLQRELAQLVQQEMKDPRVGMVTITAVRVTKEFENATVYFTVMSASGDETRETGKVLNRAAGFLRREVSHRLSLRHIPVLHFKYDESVEKGMRLTQLINAARASDDLRNSETSATPESPDSAGEK